MGYNIVFPLDRTLMYERKSLAELRIYPYLKIMEEGENPLEIAARGNDKNVSEKEGK